MNRKYGPCNIFIFLEFLSEWAENKPSRNLILKQDFIIIKGSLQKKKTKKSLEFSKPGGRGSMPIPNFFFDFFRFSLKPLGKHWKWSDSSRNSEKKISH